MERSGLGARHWVFDMDGTLTVGVHDFAGLRRALGLPAGCNILAAVSARPPAEAAELFAQVEAWELALVDRVELAAGARPLLDHLAGRGVALSLLTRNTVPVARRTLAACGLERYFEPARVWGRESAPPKPAPDGILGLCALAGVSARDSVMVGDYLYDLQAGRRAGAFTVYVGPARPEWATEADLQVPTLEMLVD